jgi:leucyl/phenylalanyl-tRNA--protein transferase
MAALTPEHMLAAYRRGIFPMADAADSPVLHWVEPRQRGIFPLEGFHISRSLRRRILAGGYEVHVNRDFMGTVRACAARPETWINEALLSVYAALHRGGHAHSLEIWQEGALAGGVFGLTIGRAFMGESMFSRTTDASKMALAYLVDRLRRASFCLFDTQFLTPHLASLGAIEIPQGRYLELLGEALASKADFTAPKTPQPEGLMQLRTQMS